MAYRRKNYDQHKRKHLYKLEPNFAGFLCTCSCKTREKDCIKESYNILNEFADQIWGVEKSGKEEGKEVGEEGATEKKEDDIDAALAEEVQALKAEAAKKGSIGPRRFQVVESGANGVVFIKTTVEYPVKLAHKIVSTLSETKQQKSRFLLRLLPVEITCRANMVEITASCGVLFDKYFKDEPKTFAIVYNHRNNDSLNRNELTEKLATMVTDRNQEHKADLKQAQLVVLVEVIRGVCCLAVIPDYFALKKYNLLEVAGIPTCGRPKTGVPDSADDKSNVVGEETQLEDNKTELQDTPEEIKDT